MSDSKAGPADRRAGGAAPDERRGAPEQERDAARGKRREAAAPAENGPVDEDDLIRQVARKFVLPG